MSIQECIADMIVDMKKDHPKAFADFMKILLEKDTELDLSCNEKQEGAKSNSRK